MRVLGILLVDNFIKIYLNQVNPPETSVVEVLESVFSVCLWFTYWYLSKINELQNTYVLTEIIILTRSPNSDVEWHYENVGFEELVFCLEVVVVLIQIAGRFIKKKKKEKESTAQNWVLHVRTCSWHLHKKDAQTFQGQCCESHDTYQLPQLTRSWKSYQQYLLNS